MPSVICNDIVLFCRALSGIGHSKKRDRSQKTPKFCHSLLTLPNKNFLSSMEPKKKFIMQNIQAIFLYTTKTPSNQGCLAYMKYNKSSPYDL